MRQQQQRNEAPTSPGEAASPAVTLEAILWGVVASLFAWLLRYFRGLQDALLAISPVRRTALWALSPLAVRETIAASIVKHAELGFSFEDMSGYCVSAEARRTLLHAGTHTLLQREPMVKQLTSELPPLGMVLLQAGLNSGRFQEAVGSSVAHSLGADLLVIDTHLMSSIAQAAFGRHANSQQAEAGPPGEVELSAVYPPSSGGLLPFFLSFFLSGGRLAFVWDSIHHTCSASPRPVVVLIRNAETLICGTPECHASFQAFQQRSGSSDTRTPVLVLAGTQLVDTGAHRLGQRPDGMRGAGATAKGYSAEEADEDNMPRFLPTAAELRMALEENAPDIRQQLSELFTVQVSVVPGKEGAQSAKHRARLAVDQEEERQSRNFANLSSAASKHCLQAPSRQEISSMCKGEVVSVSDWQKVLAWAVPMEVMIRQKLGEPLPDLTALPSCTPPLPLPDSDGYGDGDGNREEAHGEAVAAAATALSLGPAPRKAISTGSLSALAAPADDGSRPGTGPLASSEKQIVVWSAKREAAHGSSDGSPVSTATNGSGTEGLLAVRRTALRYGLQMFRKGRGSLQKQVRAENQYERALLPEVLFPEDAGNGFQEVGALHSAKDTLREAVQLPLQHPEIFERAGGLLSTPCKGVLLFGPPGTGKTMLARAAAAECGASFLVLSPSTVVSKWLGDAVKFVRAAFSLANKLSPCCMFVDEVDALLGRRDSVSEHEALRELKNEFMSQWDGIVSGALPTRVMVLAATNRPQDLDEAVLRRFNKRVFCDLPNLSGRTEILKAILANESLESTVSMEAIASTTEGFTGSDLRRLATAACMRPVREFLRNNSHVRSGSTGQVQTGDGESALGRQLPAAPANHVSGSNVLATPSNHSNDSDDVLALSSPHQAVLADFHNATRGDGEGVSLRPVTLEDFTSARSEVTTSVNADGHAMAELRQWNSKFGEGGEHRTDTTLSYFM